MNLRVLFGLAFAVFGLAPLPAAADYWWHNGSYMYMEWFEGQMEISYLTPRPGLVEIGVTEGTVLFSGKEDDDGTVSGTAYVFKGGCQPAPYHVTGSFLQEGALLQLVGHAPIRAKDSCRVDGFNVNSNSILEFYFDEPDDF